VRGHTANHGERNQTCGCCKTKLSVLDYFDRGLRRSRQATYPVVGELIHGPNGLRARYDVLVEDAVIRRVSFQASTCVTLVAYCELLAEWATGKSLRDAMQIDPGKLAEGLDGVPVMKRDRAVLATRALQSALANAVGTFGNC
jgi:NifU-like protein involved in Fe-S cluster formation